MQGGKRNETSCNSTGSRQVQNAGHRSQVRSQVRSQGTGHRAQGTGHRLQGIGHRLQGTGHRAQVTENAVKTVKTLH